MLPGSDYTISIHDWTDGTFMIEAKYASSDGTTIFTARYHQDKFSFWVDPAPIGNMMLDAVGNEYYRRDKP